MNHWNDSDGFASEARKVESAGEALLLALLWWRRAGWTVRAQEPLDQFRIDLFVPEAGVAIEVDSFGGHSSNTDMERDARKRNLVVARGWAPLSFSAQQTLFDSQNTLAHALSVITGRMLAKRPEAPPRAPVPAPDVSVAVAGSRAVLASLTPGPLDNELHLSPSHRVLANRSAAEYLGIELLEVVFDCPALIRDADIGATLAAIDGPVALAGAALREAQPLGGEFDRARFLRHCPALLHPIAVRRLNGATCTSVDDARSAATTLLRRFRGTT
jgi:very-short-patch-repair endonuclease